MYLINVFLSAKFLLLIIWLIRCSECDSNEVKERVVSCNESDVTYAINEANVQYSPSPDEIDLINVSSFYTELYDKNDDQYRIGTEPGSTNALTLYLPDIGGQSDSEVIQDYISYMINEEKQMLGKITVGNFESQLIQKHFSRTDCYCAHVLVSSMSSKTVTVNVNELFQAFLKALESKNSKAMSPNDSFEILSQLPSNKDLKNAVLNDEGNGEFPDFFVFIPRRQCVIEFVSVCARKVKESSASKFLEIVYENCEREQSMANEKVYWYQIIKEMKQYSFNTEERKLQLTSYGDSIQKLEFENANETVYVKLFKKFVYRMNNTVSFTISTNPIELIDKIIHCRKTFETELIENILGTFLRILKSCCLKNSIDIYNLSSLPKEMFKHVQISKITFNSLIKEEMKGKTFTVYFREQEISKLKVGDLFIFPNLFYIEKENFSVAEMIKDYAVFVARSVDSSKNYNQVSNEFLTKYLNAKTMDSYGEYLATRKLKKSADFPSDKSTLQNTLTELQLNDRNESISYQITYIIIVIIIILGAIISLVVLFCLKKRKKQKLRKLRNRRYSSFA